MSQKDQVTLHEPFQFKDRRNPNINRSIPPCFILSSNTSTTTDFLGLDDHLSGVISKLNLTSIHSAFCLFGTGKELSFGRSKRESIRNGIYEIAAKFKGIILSDGENSALSVEVGTARDELGHVYGDFVPLVGISANQEVLSLKPQYINEHHDALVLIKQSQNKQLVQIPLEIIWLKMISLLSERNQKPETERFTDQMPIGIILNGGNLQDAQNISQIALSSPTFRPGLVVLDKSGGLADFLIIVLKYLVERVCPNYPDFEPSTYLLLFGKKYPEMILKVNEITEDRSRFWTFTKERNFKNEFDLDLDVLREKTQIIFTKCFILPDFGVEAMGHQDFGEVLRFLIFPKSPVSEMTVEECRLRKVETSLALNQVDIARQALVESQNEKAFENWMQENQIYDQFLNHAFLNNNGTFFNDILRNLSKTYITDTFLHSDRYLDIILSWLMTRTDNETTLTIYSIVENSKPFQNRLARARKIQDVAKREIMIRDVIADVIFNLNLDLDLENIKNLGFNVRSVRNIFVVGLVTGRLEISRTLLRLSKDVLGDYLVGAIICRFISKSLPYEYTALADKYNDLANFFESDAIAILDISFHKNWTLTEQLLLRQLPHWGNNNCIELAITSRSVDFIAHQSVQRLLKSIWRGSPNPTQSMEINHYLSLVCPVAAPAFLDQSGPDKPYYQRLLQFFHTPCTIFIYTGIFKVLYLLYFAWILTMKYCTLPIIHEVILWLWTLALYMEFFVGLVRSKKLQIKAIFKCNTRGFTKLRQMAGQWTSMDTWTTIDAISYFSFLISFVARMTCIDIYRRYKTEETQIAASTMIQEFFSRATLFNGTYNLLDTTDKNCPLYFDTKYEPDYQFRSKSNNSDLDEEKNQEVFTHMRNAQYCYVITFVLFCVKTLELCTASKNLGPKVKTVVGVMGDLMFFMIILTPFMFGFGVACQSIMYTNEWRFEEVFFGTFVKPFYSMFGELWLGENTNYYFTDSIPRKRQQDLQLILDNALYEDDPFGDLDSVTCTNTIEKEKFESFQTAMAEHGKVLIRCPHKSQMTWAMMGAYQIIAHALLLNLLIACFTNTYTRINTDASLVWKFQRYDLLKTYHARSPVIPPFNLIMFPFQIIFYLAGKCDSGSELESRLRMPIKIPYDGKGSTNQHQRSTSNGRANNNRLSRDMEMQTTKGWLGERFDKIPLLRKKTDDKHYDDTIRRNKLSAFEGISQEIHEKRQ